MKHSVRLGVSRPRMHSGYTANSSTNRNKQHGRLGLTRFPKATLPGVPFPTELRIPGKRIVSLVAGGMYVCRTLSVLPFFIEIAADKQVISRTGRRGSHTCLG
jgi:hypothetical protein